MAERTLNSGTGVENINLVPYLLLGDRHRDRLIKSYGGIKRGLDMNSTMPPPCLEILTGLEYLMWICTSKN